MIILTPILLLFATVSADTTVTMNCGPCAGSSCTTLNGGPFNNAVIPTSGSCGFASATYSFVCGNAC